MGFGTVCGTYPSPQGRVGNPWGLALPIMGDEYCGQLTQDGVGGGWWAPVERVCVEVNLNGSKLASIWEGGFLRSQDASMRRR